METFAISRKEISLLEAKFTEFRETRNTLYIFLVSYIADYQKFNNNSSNCRRYLHKKYSWHTPKINYLFNSGDGFYWSVRNIAIVLGRNRSSITRTMDKMKSSEEWSSKLSDLHKIVISDNGLNIDVYHQDIFDLLLDFYEEEYLLRFAKPRHGNVENAPDINELRRFWKHLKATESARKRVFAPEELRQILLPFGWRYHLRKIWKKFSNFICTKLLRWTR